MPASKVLGRNQRKEAMLLLKKLLGEQLVRESKGLQEQEQDQDQERRLQQGLVLRPRRDPVAWTGEEELMLRMTGNDSNSL
jgi:hypothetical protein